jgi:hypothetical protein
MNRKVVLGLAIFFAIVGIALMGGDRPVVAGHGCAGVVDCGGCDGAKACHGLRLHRCQGVAKCNGAPAAECHGRVRCHGLNLCQGLRNRCHGRKADCGCNGSAAPAPAAPAPAAPAKAPPKVEKVPEAPKAASVAPLSFFQVSYRS